MSHSMQARDPAGVLKNLDHSENTPGTLTVNHNVGSMKKRFRDGFTNPSLAGWDVQTGAGTVSVSGGLLRITNTLTAAAETRLVSRERFKLPCRLSFSLLFPRIANLDLVVGLYKIDPVTNDFTTTDHASYSFLGTPQTSTNCLCRTSNDGFVIGDSTTQGTGSTASLANSYDIDVALDEALFTSGSLDGTSTRSTPARRNSVMPDLNAEYAVVISLRNGATPPASAVETQFGFFSVIEYSEVVFEAQASGLTLASSAVPVNVSTGNLSIFSTGGFLQETSTPLAASATFTGTSRDNGASGTSTRNSIAASFFASHAGTARIEGSTDATTWFPLWEAPLVANVPIYYEMASLTRYYRTVVINGASAQTALRVNSMNRGLC